MSRTSTPGRRRQHLGRPLRREVAGRTRPRWPAEWPVNTGTRTQVQVTDRSGSPRILRLSLRYFCSSSVSPDAVVDEASRPGARRCGRSGAANLTCGGKSTAPPSKVSSAARVGRLGQLLGQLGHAGQPGARDRLVGGDHQPPQAGLVVERLEHRHGDHGRAVRVGHDALRDGVERLGVDLGHDQGDLGVHAPGRGVVDDDARRRRPSGAPAPRDAAAPAEQSAMSMPGEVGRGGVLDHDLAVAATGAGCRPSGPRRRTGRRRAGRPARPSMRPHHRADLAGRTEDADAHAQSTAEPRPPSPAQPARTRRAGRAPPARPRLGRGPCTRSGWSTSRSSRC